MAITKWQRVVLPVLILGGAVVGFVLLVTTRPAGPTPEPQERVWVVETQGVALSAHRPEAILHGRVETPRVAQLTAAVSADVVAVNAREGERLEAGNVLIRLDPQEIELAVAERRSELRDLEAQLSELSAAEEAERAALEHERKLLSLAERAVDRQRDLLEQELGSQSALDEAEERHERQLLAVNQRHRALGEFDARRQQLEARRSRAETLLDRARLDLIRTEIRTPFPARIAEVGVARGDRVQPGTPVAEVYDDTALEIRARLPSRHLAAARDVLDRGETLPARGRADGRLLDLALDRLAGRAAAGTAGMDALFTVHSEASGLPLGRFVEVALSLPPVPDSLALPESALYGMDRVYRLEDDRMRAVDVSFLGRTRIAGADRVLVRSEDLDDGDRIIVTHLPNAVDGLPVTEAER